MISRRIALLLHHKPLHKGVKKILSDFIEFAIESAGASRTQVKPCVGEAAVYTRWAHLHPAEAFVQCQGDIIIVRHVPTSERLFTGMAMLAQLAYQLMNLITGVAVQRQQAVHNGLFGVLKFVVESTQCNVVLIVYIETGQLFQFANITEKLCLQLSKNTLTLQLLIVADRRQFDKRLRILRIIIRTGGRLPVSKQPGIIGCGSH